MDATRTDWDYLCDMVEAVIATGATTVNIPDTVGYIVPDEFGSLIDYLFAKVKNIRKAVISVHCHNDLGLAVANSLAAVKHGARQVECTINGIGERAGNAAMEEIVMALATRKDFYGFRTGIKTEHIYQSSRLLTHITGIPVQPNKAIVGANAFAHESGIHQDGVLKKRETYEIMKPESVGRDASLLVLGRHSGLHGFKNRLSELGLSLSEEDAKKAYARFLEIADRKKEVYDDDLYVIVSDQLGHETETYGLDYFNIQSGNMAVPTATIRINVGGERHEEAATGDGPVDAIFNAIDRALGIQTKLLEYVVQAVTPGKQAIGEVSVSLEIDGRKFVGRGASTDILEASAKAYVNSLNRWKAYQSMRRGDDESNDVV